MGSRTPLTSPRRWHVPLISFSHPHSFLFDHPHRHTYYVGAAADSVFSVIKCIGELRSCGWNADELGGLTSGSLWHVFAAAADVAPEMAREDIAPIQVYECDYYVEMSMTLRNA